MNEDMRDNPRHIGTYGLCPHNSKFAVCCLYLTHPLEIRPLHCHAISHCPVYVHPKFTSYDVSPAKLSAPQVRDLTFFYLYTKQRFLQILGPTTGVLV